MITLLHGDNIVESRGKLDELRAHARGKEIRYVDGKTATDDEILQAIESHSLFGGETLVIIENFFSFPGKKTKVTTKRAELLKQVKDTDIIVWESKEVTKSLLTALGSSAHAELFKLPVVIFDFLDNLKPGNRRTLLGLFKDATARDAPELIHALLIRRIRQLLMVRDGVMPSEVQPWQAKRLTNQAGLFTMDQLLSLYKQLHAGEIAIRTGSTPFTLSEHIEQVLINI